MEDRSEWNKQMTFLLQNLCEGHDFEFANYWQEIIIDGNKFLHCKGMPHHQEGNIDQEKLNFMLDAAQHLHIPPGSNQPLQDCWRTAKTEWCINCTYLYSENFARKWKAKELGLQTCVVVPNLIDNKLLGVVEFFSLEEWKPIPKLIGKLEHYLILSTKVTVDKKIFNS